MTRNNSTRQYVLLTDYLDHGVGPVRLVGVHQESLQEVGAEVLHVPDVRLFEESHDGVEYDRVVDRDEKDQQIVVGVDRFASLSSEIGKCDCVQRHCESCLLSHCSKPLSDVSLSRKW